MKARRKFSCILRDLLFRKASKKSFQNILNSLRLWLAILTAVIIILKFVIISYPWPSVPPQECVYPPIKIECGFVFDETHYIPAVRRMMLGDGSINREHPPLAKALMMLGIKLLGDNPIGWRFFITLSGAASIYLIGLVAYELTKDKKASFIAAALFAFDITSFNLGSIAILDPPTLMFSLLGTLFFLRRNWKLAGFTFGLAVLCKLTALLALAAVLFMKLIIDVSKSRSIRDGLRNWMNVFEKVAFIAAVVFLAGLAVYDYNYHIFSTPFEHLDFMLNYHAGLTYSESDEVYLPLSWTNPIFQFPKRLYSVISVFINGKEYHVIAYYGLQTPLWWMTWIVVAFSAYILLSNLKDRNMALTYLFVISWFSLTYLVYFPAAYILHRWVYPFYFYMTVPAIAIGLSKMLRGDALSELVLYAVLGMQLAWFIVFFPVKPLWFLQMLEKIGISP